MNGASNRLLFYAICLLFAGCGQNLTDRDSASQAAMRFTGTLGMFSKIFLQFKEDAKRANLPEDRWFPKDLQELIDQNYISEADFQKMTEGFTVLYMRPMKKIDSPVILTVFVDRSPGQQPFYGELHVDGTLFTRPVERLR